MNFLKSIICFFTNHDVRNYSDSSCCVILCRRCQKILVYSTWDNLSAEELCEARKYFNPVWGHPIMCNCKDCYSHMQNIYETFKRRPV